MLQREFAREHGVAVGDTLMAGGGTRGASCAWSASAPTAGSTDGGWADPADVLGLATAEQPLQFGVGLRLDDPADGEGVRRARVGARRAPCARSTGARSATS